MAKTTKITNNLVDNDLGLIYGTREVILSLNMGNIYYVNSNDGNDLTGARGRFDKPYKTISAALLAAPNNGDIIEVVSGTYTENVAGKVSGHTHLILRGATINGNVSVNVNHGSGRIYMLQNSVINGNITGTFGSSTISDGTGILYGEVGSTGDNGGHWVKGLYRMNSTTQNSVLYRNCLIEDVQFIACSGEFNFRFHTNFETTANALNPILRNIGVIRNTSTLTTSRIFQPNDNAVLDTMENISLIQCDSGRIYNDVFRNFRVYHCKNVTFKSKMESFFALSLSGAFYDCRFVCTDDRIFRIYESATAPATSLKFYNCQFEAGASATEIFITHDINMPASIEVINCQHKQKNLYGGTVPKTLVVSFNTFIDGLSIRTKKLIQF